ncbi:MAG: glycosyltransferase, partial [Candidatus Heimdallarchaeota archaeon]
SVLNQTFQDVEIVVVDDGSTDNTKDIINSYGEQVRYIYQENKGAASSRNTGIEASKGEYIAFLDSDDYYTAENLQKKLSLLESNSKIGWIYSDWQYIDNKGNYLDNGSVRFNYRNKKLSGEIFEELFYKRNFIATDTVVIRRSVLEDIGFFDPTIPSQEEYELWLRVSARYPVCYINEPLVIVTIHPDSLSTDFSKWAYGNALIIDKIEKILPDNFTVRKRIMDRMHADKYTFLARDFVQKRQFKNALNAYWQSIKHFPLQKRIYWLLILLMVQFIKAHLKSFSIIKNTNDFK